MKQRCKETLARAYLFLDGEVLSQEERVEISVHLEECTPCYERVGIEREVMFVVSRLKGSTQCPEHLRENVSRLLDEA